jgi:cytochrome c oxidase assembly factor CtaG
MLWLVGGLVFWYPIVARRPARPRFVPPLRMLYLVVGLMFSPIMFGLVGFMLYAEHPLYGLYELAPPFPGWTAKMDHELAGVMMSLSGAIVAFTGLSVIFFRWSKTDG